MSFILDPYCDPFCDCVQSLLLELELLVLFWCVSITHTPSRALSSIDPTSTISLKSAMPFNFAVKVLVKHGVTQPSEVACILMFMEPSVQCYLVNTSYTSSTHCIQRTLFSSSTLAQFCILVLLVSVSLARLVGALKTFPKPLLILVKAFFPPPKQATLEYIFCLKHLMLKLVLNICLNHNTD